MGFESVFNLHNLCAPSVNVGLLDENLKDAGESAPCAGGCLSRLQMNDSWQIGFH